MDVYRKCEWKGKEPDCTTEMGDSACSWSDKYTMPLVWGYTGSGDQNCKDSRGRHGSRPYCCDEAEDENARWTNCNWHYDFESSLTHIAGTEYCYGNCPGNKIRVALQKNDFEGPVCAYSTQAFCCDAEVTISAETKEKGFSDALKAWVKNPTCPSKGLSTRDATPVEGSDKPTLVRREWPLPSEEILRDTIELIIESPPGSKLIYHVQEVWNDNVQPRWENLGAATLAGFWYPLRNVLRDYKQASQLIAAATLCNMDAWNKAMKSRTMTDTIHCPLPALASVEPSLLLNPDNVNSDQSSTTVISPLGVMEFPFDFGDWFGIEDRTGPIREFKVKCPKRGKATFPITSEKYINGDKGDALAQANGDKDRWYVNNEQGNCYRFGISSDGKKDSEEWVCKCSPCTESKRMMLTRNS
jgi:hypothetical protein